MSRVQVRRDLGWTDPLTVAGGLVADGLVAGGRGGRDGVLCLLSDPTVPGSRSFVATDPDRTLIVDRASGGLFDSLRDADWGEGVVGLPSYDAGARPATGPRDAVWPDLMLARYPALLAFDHDARVVTAVGWGDTTEAATRACDLAEGWIGFARVPTAPPPPVAVLSPEVTAQTYRDAVADVVDRIAAGELFQANMAQAWTARMEPGADPFDVFVRLTQQGGSPYGAFWRMGDRAIVSNSPEMFVVWDPATGRVETCPIKGTRARGEDAEADAAQIADLVASAKDRAENLMIVDLMRNDLARVCLPGSVRVERLFEVETYRTVHHLVSTISGDLTPGLGAAEVLEATFPPGSITGAPKHQAMKVIAGLEPPRGPWCGSLFLIDEGRRLTASVLIRTAAFERVDGRWQVRTLAGAGIVADSDPETERLETEVKISALRVALTGSTA